MKRTRVIGIMSGTSLDGVDLALVSFDHEEDKYEYELKKAITIPYPERILNPLKICRELSNDDLVQLHLDWACFVGEKILESFRSEEYDLVSSHGHTVFHQPAEGFTLQIGSPVVLSKLLNTAVVADFRSRDVSMGGQGAPLVPVGDLFLYPEYRACVNLGGIANLSVKHGQKIKAFDLCPCNLILNRYVGLLGETFDKGGEIARSGKLIPSLLDELNTLSFYQEHGLKSLGIEQVESHFYPLLDKYGKDVPSLLYTYCKHVASKFKAHFKPTDRVLFTGGGTHHQFLMECIVEQGINVNIPSRDEIDFKEAIIFAFLGLRHIEEKYNVLSCVTGAAADHIGGQLFSPE